MKEYTLTKKSTCTEYMVDGSRNVTLCLEGLIRVFPEVFPPEQEPSETLILSISLVPSNTSIAISYELFEETAHQQEILDKQCDQPDGKTRYCIYTPQGGKPAFIDTYNSTMLHLAAEIGSNKFYAELR